MKQALPYLILCIAIIAVSFYQVGSLLAWGLSITNQAPEQSAQVQAAAPAEDKIVLPKVEKHTPFQPEGILITKINVNLKVVTSPQVNGSWDVFDGVANFAEGTSLVSSAGGNVGLFAHDRSNGFTRIKELVPGDHIMITGQGQQAIYKVSQRAHLQPSDVHVFNATEAPTLTLITCDGIFSEKRYMVKAELMQINPLEVENL